MEIKKEMVTKEIEAEQDKRTGLAGEQKNLWCFRQ